MSVTSLLEHWLDWDNPRRLHQPHAPQHPISHLSTSVLLSPPPSPPNVAAAECTSTADNTAKSLPLSDEDNKAGSTHDPPSVDPLVAATLLRLGGSGLEGHDLTDLVREIVGGGRYGCASARRRRVALFTKIYKGELFYYM